MTTIKNSFLEQPGSPLEGENPHPFFREPDLPVAGEKGFPEDKLYRFGTETGFRILPYTRQDRYGRTLQNLKYGSVVMENDFLRAEFLPGLGGRLWSLYDKKERRDILYKNPVFRPANLAIREAWLSGGIEWNIGRLGHAAHTCAPVFAGTFEGPGSPCLRIWEFERQTRLYWRVEFRLAENAPILCVYVRIENPGQQEKSLYWWTNAAVPQTKGVRVLSAAADVIYIVPGTGNVKTMGYGALPSLPVLPGVDASYPANSTFSNEYFFQNDRRLNPALPEGRAAAPYPWESAVYEDGYAYAEASTAPLIYRKMFCWGSGPGGRRWQDFLSLPGEEYLEVQAGLAPTQLHTTVIGPGAAAAVDWVQAFTAFRTDPAKIHRADYLSAAAHAEACIAERISPAFLETALNAGRSAASIPVQKIIYKGTGWGALEKRLDGTPPGLLFTDDSITGAEMPWAELLRTGSLPLRTPAEGPGSFSIHETWEALLKKSPVRAGDWLTPYHLGVIACEGGDPAAARSWWKRSLEAAENPWAYRNLGITAEGEEALAYYKKAFELSRDFSGEYGSFEEEYIRRLFEYSGGAAAALDACMKRREKRSAAELSEGLRETAALIALARGDDQTLDSIFAIEPAHLREGNNILTDIWKEREAARLVENGTCASLAEAREQAGKLTPPRNIDFRMY
jgi:hypothetical protein